MVEWLVACLETIQVEWLAEKMVDVLVGMWVVSKVV